MQAIANLVESDITSNPEINNPALQGRLEWLRDRLKHCNKRIANLYAERNRYVHAIYDGADEVNAATLMTFRVKGRIRNEFVTVTGEELYETYVRIADLRQDLAEILRAVDERGEWHDKLPGEDAQQIRGEAPSPDPK